MKFIVTGHPRCGTGYMARLLQYMGHAVGHEDVRTDGVSAWSWAVVDGEAPWCSRARVVGDRTSSTHFIHVLRDPQKAIWSIAYAYDDDMAKRYMRKHTGACGGEGLEQAALSYLGWNDIIAQQNPDLTVHVETAAADLPTFLGTPPPVSLPPANFNSRPKKDPPQCYGEPLEDHLPPLIWQRVAEWALEHGYEVGVHA